MANLINTHLRLKICIVWWGSFNLRYVSIEFVVPNLSLQSILLII